MNTQPVIIIAALLLAACADTAPVPGQPETDTINLTDDAADSLEQLRVRADGMTVWAEPRVLSENTWLFQARTSHSLTAVSATVNGDAAPAKLVSARKFEVRLTAKQMEDNLAEIPLFVTVRTVSGLHYNIMLGARARFVDTTGSSKLYPWKNIAPIMVGRDRVFRGRVTTPASIVMLAGWNDDDSEPISSQEDATHWMLDWYPGTLAWSAHPTEDALYLVGDDAAGNRYRRTAPIHIEVSKLGVSNQAPTVAWPPQHCASMVTRCLADFDTSRDDLEACGTAAEVSACLADVPVDDTPVWIQRFAGDFRRHLISYYGQHEADIVGSGGNTRPQALLAVDSARIEEVTDPDEVPSGHSLDDNRVFTHPDVTFPGSDIVWFGVYNRASGDLVDIYDHN